ncbi:SRPBCC family protein [Prescottella defluvii]|uniref:SRPBCC family protein n=1 Tax=Prescottella defluvii TaxID=1323361 RepID=UPI0004F30A4A|nr:SRPBCC family protein [Prescottella defluvii]
MTATKDGIEEEQGSAVGADQLKSSLQHLVGAVTQKGVKSLTDTITSTVGNLDQFASNGGSGGLASAVSGLSQGESPAKVALKAGMSSVTGKIKEKGRDLKEALTGGGKGKGKGKKDKITNIVEQIDIGAPVDLVYDQWTEFADFPRFMKKLEQVEQVSDEKLRWKAQVFWSHRSWESTILEQVQDERIVWRSKGDKGYLDGAITFHELTPDLTRVVVVIEYHPQGFFEKTGNIWRAQGRRIRLELKHFQRQVMIQTLLHPDDVEGWHGEIRDGEVVPEEERDESEGDEEEFDEPENDEDRGEDGQEEQDEPDEPDEPDEDDESADAESGDDDTAGTPRKSRR